MSKYVLLTGATGLLGRYLLRDLLLEGTRVAVVARGQDSSGPNRRIDAILQYWEAELGRSLPRPVCLAGDLTQPDLGLDSASQNWVAKNCDRMLHNAAVLQFHSTTDGEPFRSNVDGTRNVLDLCRDAGIGEMHYVSTAYVCGLREDLVREDELDAGQKFRNVYEESKFLAEKAVREAEFLDSVTIYRPGVVAGDSRTGYTSTYHGLYVYLKLMFVLTRNAPCGPDGVRHTPVRLQMTGDEQRNIVPVDWVTEVMCQLFFTPSAHGRTYHLTPEHPVTPREFIDCGMRYLNSQGVEFVGPESEREAPNELEEAAAENTVIYQSYETSDPQFDRSNVERFAPNLPCPRIDEPMLVRYFEFAEEDRWGKRRSPKVEPSLDVERFLRTRIANRTNGSPVKTEFSMGLDCAGPGGGQFTLGISKNAICWLDRGLPNGDTPIVSLTSEDFEKMAEGDNSADGSLTLQEFADGLDPAVLQKLGAAFHRLLVSPPVDDKALQTFV